MGELHKYLDPEGAFPPRGGQPTRHAWAVLAIDDEPRVLSWLEACLMSFQNELKFFRAESGQRGAALAAEINPGLVFLDLGLADMNGMELLPHLLAGNPGREVVLLTGSYSVEAAVEAMRAGAADYLTKPVSVQRIHQVVSSWLERVRKHEFDAALDSHLAETWNFQGMVGRSPLMQDLFGRIRRIAPHSMNVLITGETGTGKELVARSVHELSPRMGHPFVVCNCAAISEGLFESELFGHVRGAYTGAHTTQPGLIEHAAGGTLFLDEIGEIPLAIQAKLLRFLQTQEIKRLGDPKVKRIDVRLVAATNRDLAKESVEGRFRSDLYYRLSMVEIRVPRLKDRKEDIGPLVQHFLKGFAVKFNKPGLRLSPRARLFVDKYNWPGNVRELENCLQYACMLCHGDIVEVEDFPLSVRNASQLADDPPRDTVLTLQAIQDRYVIEVLKRFNGNRSRAAEALGIGRTTLYRILERLGIQDELEAPSRQ